MAATELPLGRVIVLHARTCWRQARGPGNLECVVVREDAIRMVPYDPCWRESYEDEASRLTAVLRRWLVRPIEHIGSTSVPGLVAKPIIDMVAVVADIQAVNDAGDPLAQIGWVPAPEPTDVIFREMSFCAPSVERRSHHLHVVEETSSGWREWIAFRDYLRVHPQLAAEYGELKLRLAADHGSDPNDRDAYRAGKAGWIRSVTSCALRETSEK